MKSFTRNQASPYPNGAQDKRFEALVKKEMVQHQHVISSYQKEMQALKDSINVALQRAESLTERNAQDLEEFKVQSNNLTTYLRNKILSQEVTIYDLKKTIDDLHQQLLAFHVIYASKLELENVKKEADSRLNDGTLSNLVSVQGVQRELKGLFQSLKNDFERSSLEMSERLNQLASKEERDFETTRIDKESILKELRIYQKDLFVIEKKIENIYTLIERINKRGELCHKPA